MSYRLLVIEEETVPTGVSVCAALAQDGAYHCQASTWTAVARDGVKCDDVQAIVAVTGPQTAITASVFEWLRGHALRIPTIAVLPPEADEQLLRLASQTAADFIISPIRTDELRHRLQRMLGPSQDDVDVVRQKLLTEMGLTQLVGADPVFVKAIECIPLFAKSGMPVLITGETGTGKELCAHAIHHLGERRNCPFVAVDCGTVPEHLFENELFGHVRGAFTDAHRDQRGLVAMAEGGTLFLDEIDALSVAVQAKLLRLLQDYTYRPVGATDVRRADINIIAATNRDLESCVGAKQFRSDLYFRLNVLRLHLPPLRERRGDIAVLARHFLETARQPAGSIAKSFAPAALRELMLCDWPGNVRELSNVVQRASLLAEGSQILPCHLARPTGPPPREASASTFREGRAAALAKFERRYVEELLQKHAGNVTHAAREAQKERRAFGRLLKKYNIDRRAS